MLQIHLADFDSFRDLPDAGGGLIWRLLSDLAVSDDRHQPSGVPVDDLLSKPRSSADPIPRCRQLGCKANTRRWASGPPIRATAAPISSLDAAIATTAGS